MDFWILNPLLFDVYLEMYWLINAGKTGFMSHFHHQHLLDSVPTVTVSMNPLLSDSAAAWPITQPI